MFQYQKQDLNFQLAFNSFREEVLHKNMLVQSLVFEYQKLGNQPNLSKSTIQCIKFSRRVMDDIHGILQSIKIYLTELKLQFLYDLLVKTFQILVISFNLLSNKFMSTLQSKKISLNYNDQIVNKPVPKSDSQPKSKNRSQFKEMEYFDFLIKNLEEEEQKLNEKKKQMELQLLQEKRSIKTMSPSQTVNQLEILNKDLQRIIANSQKIAGENVLFRYQELTKRILLLKKPEEINSEFCSKISSSVKEKFFTTMERIIKQLYIEIKHKQKQQLLLEILGSKPTLNQATTQTQGDLKPKLIDQLTKQKKNLQNQLQSLKKANSILQNEIDSTIEKYKTSKQTIRYLQKRNEDLDQLSKKKATQINSLKLENEKKNQQLLALQKVKTQFERLNKTDTLGQQMERLKENIGSDESQYPNALQDSLKTSKCKALREKSTNSIFYDRDMLIQRKQNFILRSSLEKVINRLAQPQLITAAEIDKDLKSGILTQKIDEIISSLPSKQLQTNLVKNADLQPIFRQTKSFQEIQLKEVSTQTEKTQNRVTINEPPSGKSNQKEDIARPIKQSKLEALKIQFLEKLKRKKQQGLFHQKYRIKQNNQYNSQFQYANKSMENDCIGHADFFDDFYSIQKSKPQVSKNIFIQDLSLGKNNLNRKNVSRGKKNEPMKTEYSKEKVSFDERFSSKPISLIQNFEMPKEISSIIALIEAKNDSKDYFLNKFVRGLFEEFEKMKGRPFVENILQKQLTKIGEKSIKTSMKVIKPKKNVEFIRLK